MDAFELVLLLIAVVAAVALVAERLEIPAPILMVIAGLVLGPAITALPDAPSIELEPETVLVIFLPPILFSAAFFLSPRELWRNVRPITLLAVGLVITTTLAVAAVAILLVPQLGWPAAIALGAIVSPPDAIAATSIARRLRLPRRLVIILEGESLVNDATALTVYGLAVTAVVTGASLSLTTATTSFVVVAVGGALIGLVVGWITTWMEARLQRQPPIAVLVSLLAPFAAYLPAEAVGVSGVVSTVVAGLFLGWRAPRILRSDSRLLAAGTWQMVIFVVNGLAFLLVGLQLPTVIEDIEGYSLAQLIGMGAAVSATVILVRLAWVYPAAYLPRWLIPSVGRRDPAPPARVILILGWAGMRGAVTLAAALALPHVTQTLEPFPERGLVIFLAFSVILVTLIGQGLTLPSLIRALDVVDDGSLEHEELHAREVATDAALLRIQELRAEAPGHLPLLDQLKERYEHRGAHGAHRHPDDGDLGSDLSEEEVEELEHDEIRRSIISAERLAILELRDRGEITDDTLRSIERDLDLDELRREA